MKTKHLFLGCLWLCLCFLEFSCSKSEISTPEQKGEFLSTKNVPELICSRVDYNLLDVFPSFPGSDSSFRQYLKNKINYPQSAIENNIVGKVFVSFIVEKDGSISEIETLKGLGYGCDETVKEAIRQMPSWSPGKIKGNNVRVKIVIPVEFKH